MKRAHLHALSSAASSTWPSAAKRLATSSHSSSSFAAAQSCCAFIESSRIENLPALCGERTSREAFAGGFPIAAATVDRVVRSPETAFFNRNGDCKTMDPTVLATDWQPQASAGKASQGVMPFMALVPQQQMLPGRLIEQATFNGCLTEAARHSGMEDQEIADRIHICHGYMSRFMRGVAQQWTKRLVAFMRTTRSLAPLQWIAHQMGCELIVRDSQAQRIAALQAELRELQGVRA